MKATIILGSIVGFLIGALFGLAGGGSWPTALWRAGAAALAAAILTHWWCQIWIHNLRDAFDRARNAASAPQPKPAAKP